MKASSAPIPRITHTDTMVITEKSPPTACLVKRIAGGKDMIMPTIAKSGRINERMCNAMSSMTKRKEAMAVLCRLLELGWVIRGCRIRR
jgi:hypothetical protein